MAKKSLQTVRKTQKQGDKRGTNPASLANLHPFPKGVSGNPSGRPKLLGESYKAMLARVNEKDADKRTNAELIANAALVAALGGDVSAMREIRAATEGEKITLTSWQSEIVDALKKGNLTPQQVIDEIGIDDARAILVAAGTVVISSAPAGDTPDENGKP